MPLAGRPSSVDGRGPSWLSLSVAPKSPLPVGEVARSALLRRLPSTLLRLRLLDLVRLCRPRWATLVLFGAVVAVTLFRYRVLAGAGAPSTIDAGNWLNFADSLLGDNRGFSLAGYPPVVPAVTGALVTLLGAVRGVALMGALCSAAPSLGVYRALGMAGLKNERLIPAVLILGTSSIGEAAAWGGFPQLLGIGLMPIAAMVAIETFDAPSRVKGVKLGLVVMASLATTHFVSVVIVVVIGLILVSAVFRNWSPMWRRDIMTIAPVILLPSIWLVPVYLKLSHALILNPNEFSAFNDLTWRSGIVRLNGLNRGATALWRVLVPLAVASAMVWPLRRKPVWRLSTSLLLATLALLLVTREARFLYLVPLVVATGVATWLKYLTTLRPWLVEGRQVDAVRVGLSMLTAAVLVAQLLSGLSIFQRQRDFYGVLTPGIVTAIVAADADTAGNQIIAIPSLDDAPIGWWVEGLTDAQVVYGSPLRWLNFADEVKRAQVANNIFDPAFPDEATLAELEAASVNVVILPRRWTWFDDDLVEQWIDRNDLAVLERNIDALAIEIG